MPIFYGQVKGYRWDTPQPLYDPENPKPSKYGANKRKKEDLRFDITHGKWGYDKGCRCEECRKAHRKAQEEYRKKEKIGGLATRCSKCRKFFRADALEGGLCEKCRSDTRIN